jgi:hypothetical protein
MECTAPLAQAVLPGVCSDSGAVAIEGIELLDVELNSTLTPIEGAPGSMVGVYSAKISRICKEIAL